MSQGNSAPSKIPNLYELLKLKPKESDDQLIRTALKEFAENVKRIEVPETAQQAAKLFAIAKQNLLDPQRKAAYDSLWDKVFGTTQRSETGKTQLVSAAAGSTESKNPSSPNETESNKRSVSSTANSKARPSVSAQAIAETVAKVAAKAASVAATEHPQSSPPAPLQQDSASPTLTADRANDSSSVFSAASSANPDSVNGISSFEEDASDWDLSELTSMLPKGDPSAPLDLAAFLESTDINVDGQRTVEDLERDFQKLFKLLGGVVAEESHVDPSDPRKSVEDPFSFAAQPSSSTSLVTSTSIPTASIAQAASSRPVAVNTIKARKRRDSSLLLMIGGGITTLLCVLGFLLMMLKKSSDAKQLAAGNLPTLPVNSNAVGNNVNQSQDSKTKSQIGSGLPQVGSGLPKPGEQIVVPDKEMNSQAMNSGDANGMQPNDSPAMQTNSKPAMEPTTTTAAVPESMAKPDVPPKTTNESSTSPEPSKPTEPEKSNSAPPMEVVEQKPVELTAQEKAAWKKQMTEARNLLGNREFDKADQLLEKITAAAKNPDQKAQLKRLKTIAPLVKSFHDALLAALKGSSAGDEISVDRQKIAFSDFIDDKVISVKIESQKAPKHYEFNDLPVKVAYAFADLKLDQSPTSAAAKAAFTAVHKKANKNNKEDARKLMQTAAAANVVPDDTHEVFDDDYSVE